MPVGWRISQFPGLTGIGGHHVDGRWHTKPRSVLYLAEHPALAALEVMAHLRLNVTTIPTTLKLIRVTIGDGATVLPEPDLPDGWQANEPTTRALGNAFVDGGNGLVLSVPSAILPHSVNFVVNAAHAQAATHLREDSVEPFWFDARFLR